jgi:hypothetical protein
MNFIEWTILLTVTLFVAACLWAWEQLDRAARAEARAADHQKKGAPQGFGIARANPQNQQDAKKESVPPCGF